VTLSALPLLLLLLLAAAALPPGERLRFWYMASQMKGVNGALPGDDINTQN